jgi:ribosomal protein L17
VLLLESLQNLNNLIDAFAFTEYNFGKTRAQRSMMIKPRVTQIFKRQIPQSIESTLNRARSGAHFIQKFAE